MTRHWEEGYKGPLPGNQLEFTSPFARKGQEAETTQESRVICYCNEFVGLGLGFPLSPARMGIFDGPEGATGTNRGSTYSKRANKGANQFKLMLRPGTGIQVTYFHPETFRPETSTYIKKSISLSFDSTVSVSEFKLWIAGAAYPKEGLMLDVYAFVAPSLKIHPIGSRSNPTINIPVTTAMSERATALGVRKVGT